jgi:hypothetical protein
MPSASSPRQPLRPNVHHPHRGPHPRYHRDLTYGNPARPQRRNSPIFTFTETFSGADSVIFIARATRNGCPNRTRTVNYKGALMVFDALEAVPTRRPLLLFVSSADVRDLDQSPSHWVSTRLSMRPLSHFALFTPASPSSDFLFPLHLQNIE